MDYDSIIQALRAEVEQIDRAIAQLEVLNSEDGGEPPKRRGRKSMGTEERKQVAERMRRYWADQRTKKSKGQGGVL